MAVGGMTLEADEARAAFGFAKARNQVVELPQNFRVLVEVVRVSVEALLMSWGIAPVPPWIPSKSSVDVVDTVCCQGSR